MAAPARSLPRPGLKEAQYQQDTSLYPFDLSSMGPGALSCSPFRPSAKMWSMTMPVYRGWEMAVSCGLAV